MSVQRQGESHFMEASPTLRQPLRLNCLRKPPQRLEMFSTTRPWETQAQRRKRVIWLGPQGSGSAVTSQPAPKPTDPALSLGLDNATQQAHTSSTNTHKHRPPLTLNTTLTSMSVWKLKRSIFCQLLPSRARTFHAWEGNRHETDKWVRQRWWKVNGDCVILICERNESEMWVNIYRQIWMGWL